MSHPLKTITYGEEFAIRKTGNNLAELYPIEANFGSRVSLWGRGLDDGIVTREEYNKAAKMYGRIWNYTGD